MNQFQINKADFSDSHIVSISPDQTMIDDGEVLLKVERFGFSANNITYAAMGEQLNYWKFFPAADGTSTQVNWGVLPVWGFATVEKSNVDGIEQGERIFGYLPPASHLKIRPVGITPSFLFDGSDHRRELPKAYNSYQRVDGSKLISVMADNLRMLLYPLYLTSFCLANLLRQNDWYGAEQVLIVSASSKTSIGLAYALDEDDSAPDTVGLTSELNRKFVNGLGIYQSSASYDSLENDIAKVPTAIVDMSGNGSVIGRLHQHLGDHMVKTINVGLTHWETSRSDSGINRERSEFFFAPTYIQELMKSWGTEEFNRRSTKFITGAAQKSTEWLRLDAVIGLKEFITHYDLVRSGQSSPERGIVVEL